MSILSSHYAYTVSCLLFSDLCAFPMCPTQQFFANPHFLPSAALWHPLIPSLHFPYSLSPLLAFLLQTHTPTYANSPFQLLSLTLSSSLPLILPLYVFAPPLYLPSFRHASHWISLYMQLTCSALSASIQSGCSIDEGSIIGRAIQICLPKIVSRIIE